MLSKYQKKAKEFKINNVPKPINTENVIWAHSLNVLYDITTPEEKLSRIFSIKPNSEISVSKVGEIDTMISTYSEFGVYVKGICTLMADRDIGSEYVKETGERLPGYLEPWYYIEDYNWLFPVDSHKYCECFIKEVQVIGIWINKNYINKYEKFIEKGLELGLSIHITEQKEIIRIEENDDDYL